MKSSLLARHHQGRKGRRLAAGCLAPRPASACRTRPCRGCSPRCRGWRGRPASPRAASCPGSSCTCWSRRRRPPARTAPAPRPRTSTCGGYPPTGPPARTVSSVEEAARRPHHPVREEGDEEGEDVLLLLPALELDGAVLHGEELEAGVARDALLPAHHPLLLTVHGADPHHALQHHSQPAVRSKYFILHMQTEGFVTVSRWAPGRDNDYILESRN